MYCVFHKLAQGHPALRAPWWTGSVPYINKLVASHMGVAQQMAIKTS